MTFLIFEGNGNPRFAQIGKALKERGAKVGVLNSKSITLEDSCLILGIGVRRGKDQPQLLKQFEKFVFACKPDKVLVITDEQTVKLFGSDILRFANAKVYVLPFRASEQKLANRAQTLGAIARYRLERSGEKFATEMPAEEMAKTLEWIEENAG